MPAKMLVDTGCTRTLVHRKFVSETNKTPENITILTATGRSSYGRIITREDLLNQWGTESDKAFVTTRSQTKQKAQDRIEELMDRENILASKTLSLRTGKEPNRTNPDEHRTEEEENKVPDPVENDSDVEVNKVNILDRNVDQVISDQKNDVTLSQCRNNASADSPKDKDGYFYEKGMLMHRKYSDNSHNGLPYVDRIVVPESYRPEILRISHTLPLAGHLGREKTISRIGAHFYWPRLSFDVRKYCATCPECQLVARKMTALRAPLKPVPIVAEPFRKIAIDIVGELPRTKTGYKYILTMVDYATRYPEAFPLRNTNSKVIADNLVTFISRVGIPDEIVSDQAANLLSKLMTQLFEQLGISRIKTSVYHSEANGLVERFNGTLKQMLRKFVSENVGLWDKYLPYLLFAYREVPCVSTGYSPFELLYGRTIRGPLAVIKETWMEKTPPDNNLITYIQEMRRRMSTMQQAVYQSMKGSQAKQKENYDKKSSTRKFDKGDKVLVLLPTPGSKLETKWQGPYTVTSVKEEGRTYEVDTGKRKKQLRTYNINMLSRWQSRDEATAFVMAWRNHERCRCLTRKVCPNLPVKKLCKMSRFQKS
ncbi:hypothetical protein QZH41_003112 [Actinostola sp. cb2023]|nr:hypothetical protein QZH41_003112 [Actinostola sp. cb2023]